MTVQLRMRDRFWRELRTSAPSSNRRTTVIKSCSPMSAKKPEVIGLFPVPFMRAPRVLGSALVAGLVEHFGKSVALPNSSSPNLTHTALLKPGDSPLLVETAALLAPL